VTATAWRIAVEAPGYAANDLTGAGAKISGGRWNSAGLPVVYCAINIALAVLETVHYLRNGGLPFNRFLVRIDIPDDIWGARTILNSPPGGWDAIPAGMSSRRAGDAWLNSLSSAVLEVPSVIVPQETSVLINPVHPDAAKIGAVTLERWHYDPRFFP
jgi:RES domain-containing protein